MMSTKKRQQRQRQLVHSSIRDLHEPLQTALATIQRIQGTVTAKQLVLRGRLVPSFGQLSASQATETERNLADLNSAAWLREHVAEQEKKLETITDQVAASEDALERNRQAIAKQHATMTDLKDLQDLQAKVADARHQWTQLCDLRTRAAELQQMSVALQADVALRHTELRAAWSVARAPEGAVMSTAPWTVAVDLWHEEKKPRESTCAPTALKKWQVHKCANAVCTDDQCWMDCDAFTAQTLDTALASGKSALESVHNPVLRFSYDYDLQAQTQTNRTSKTVRKLRRQEVTDGSVHVDGYVGQCNSDRLLAQFTEPRVYAFFSPSVTACVQRVRESAEYTSVCTWFLDSPMASGSTMRTLFPGLEVMSVERVVHVDLARQYTAHTLTRPLRERTEVIGFHGTRANDPYQVVARGLNPLAGNANGYLGQGIYGAASAVYSHNHFRFTKDGRGSTFVILVVRFLLGRQLRTKETLPGSSRFLDYDSAVGTFDDCDIFAVYDRSRCYASHVFTYRLPS